MDTVTKPNPSLDRRGVSAPPLRRMTPQDEYALALAVEAGPGALQLFENGKVPLAIYIRKRIASALALMEQHGVPEDLKQALYSWQVEGKLARVS